MNTIYDGSFVLGQTSATNFQAGPGISITQPSEGTVRIANDETVLWAADFSTTTTLSNTCLKQGMSATLSESKNNFEKLEVWSIWNPNAGQGQAVITTYPAANSAGGYVLQAGASHPMYMARGVWSASDSTFYIVSAAQSDSWPNFNWNSSYGGVIKIVGINRKEV